MSGTKYKKFFDLDSIVKEIKKYLKSFDDKKFLRAFDFAENAHRGQVRKDGTTPYIVHPVEIVKILGKLHADEDILVAALLHDVPEDTAYDIHQIRENFGNSVAFLVDGITKLSKVQYKHDMPKRQVESLKKLFLHSAKDPRVIIIKLADRLHNMRTLHFIEEESKRARIAGETLEIYVPMANLLGIQEIKSELEDLCFRHLFPTEYKQLSEKINKYEKTNKDAVKQFHEKLESIFKKNGIQACVFERKRNIFSIYKKLCDQGKTINDVENRIAIRIIVSNVTQCYQALGIIHSRFTPTVKKFKDYIASPKSNGYQSLHTTVFGPRGLLTEVQIKTEEMHLEAEHGIAANFFLDRKDTMKSDKRSNWMDKVVEIEHALNKHEDFLENLKEDIFQERIFVFSPRGMTIDLPKGASAVDFAYAIHTDVGNHAVKAEINGKVVPLTTPLHNRDVVNVIKSDDAIPSVLWLTFAVTNNARANIKEFLKKSSKDKKIFEGKRMLQKEFDIAGLGLIEKVNFKKINQSVAKDSGRKFKSFDDLLESLGEGGLRALDVANAFKKYRKRLEKKNAKNQIPVNVKVVAKNRFGLLKDIADVFYKYTSDMNYLKGYASKKEKNALFTAKICVDDLSKVGRIFEELEQIEDVKYVYRISYRGMYLTVALSIITAFVWVMHPFILRKVFSMGDFENEVLINLFINFALVALLFIVLYLTRTVKLYFPLVRKRKALWIATFSIPALALLMIIIEIFYFKLPLNWIAIVIEIAIIYTYLGISFRNYKKLS